MGWRRYQNRIIRNMDKQVEREREAQIKAVLARAAEKDQNVDTAREVLESK